MIPAASYPRVFMSSLDDVKVEISVLLGRSVIPMHQLLRMGRGAVIELDSRQDQAVTVLANNKAVAKGEIIIEGDRIAVSVSEILMGYGDNTHSY
jgi:flagellar motor switch protein FliN